MKEIFADRRFLFCPCSELWSKTLQHLVEGVELLDEDADKDEFEQINKWNGVACCESEESKDLYNYYANL